MRRLASAITAVLAVVAGAVTAPAGAAPAPASLPSDFPASITVTVPAGGTATSSSPTLPKGADEETIKVKNFFTGAESQLRSVLPTLSNGKKLLACAVFGSRASGAMEGDYENRPPDEVAARREIALMAMCFRIVEELARAGTATTSAMSPQLRSKCAVTTVAVPIAITRSGAGFEVAPTGDIRLGARNPLRVTCRQTGADMSLTVRTRSAKQQLRSFLGPRARVGFQSPATNTSASSLTITYQQPR